jgi:predicted ABC-type ATPase
MKLLDRIFSFHKRIDDNLHYESAMQNIQLVVDCAQSPLEKIRAYNYAMFIIRADYAAYTKSLMFRKEFADRVAAFFPASYYLADGTKETFTKEPISNIISLAQADGIVAFPWEYSRLARILPEIYQKGFIADENHKANYYAEIDLTVVFSGNHSISAGIFYGSGSINANVYLLSKLYEHVDTDGVNWINRHNGQVLTPVLSEHLAILYEISRRKNGILRSLDHDSEEYCRINGGAFTKIRKCYTVVCGMPCAGKTSFIGTMFKDNAVLIDKSTDTNAFDVLIQKGESIIEENMCFGSAQSRIRSAKDSGYYIRLIFIGISANESLQRATIRFIKTGRQQAISDKNIISEIETISRQFCKLMQMCDSADYFDNEDIFIRVAHWDGQTFSFYGKEYPEWLHSIHTAWLDSLSK